MNFRVNRIYMFEVSWREYDGLLVKDFGRRDLRGGRRKTNCFSEAGLHQMHQERAEVPHLKGGTAQVHIIDFDSLFYILGHTLKEGLLCFRLMESGIDQVYAKDANRLLLKEVGRIPHVDVQHDVVWLAFRLELKAQTHPTVRLICSRIAACGDGIDNGEKAGLRPSSFPQLLEELIPLAIQHCFKSFSGHIADSGPVEIVADFLIISRNGFGDGAGSRSHS